MQKSYIIERKEKKKKYIESLDDDGTIVHCSMANGVQAPEKLNRQKVVFQSTLEFNQAS